MYTKASKCLVENTEDGHSPCYLSLNRKYILKPTNRTRWCPDHSSHDTESKTKGRRWYVSVIRSVKVSLCAAYKRVALVGLTGLGLKSEVRRGVTSKDRVRGEENNC